MGQDGRSLPGMMSPILAPRTRTDQESSGRWAIDNGDDRELSDDLLPDHRHKTETPGAESLGVFVGEKILKWQMSGNFYFEKKQGATA
jgi:hypothetical protein